MKDCIKNRKMRKVKSRERAAPREKGRGLEKIVIKSRLPNKLIGGIGF